jgi:hypothetical protein
MKRLLVLLGFCGVLLCGSLYYHYGDPVHYEEYHTGKYDNIKVPLDVLR